MSATTPPPSPAPSPSPMPSSPPARRPRRRAALGGGIAVLLLIALFAFVFTRLSTGILLTTPFASVGSAPADWITYLDPAGYFSIRVPPTWRATSEPGTATMGDRDGSFTSRTEDVTIGLAHDPLLGMGVSVDVVPLPSDFARHWECAAWTDPPDTLLAGLPARDGDDTWLLDTSAAHYQISTPFSPRSMPGGTAQIPTPIPRATITAERQTILLVVSTFRPIPATPLKCG